MNFDKKHNKLISWFLERPVSTSFLTFLFLSVVAGFIVHQQYQLLKEHDRREMNNILQVVHQNIEQSLKNYTTTTLTLALSINDQGIPKDFEYVSKRLIESNKSIFAVQLVPNGVIKYIYPLEKNKAAVNLNILTDPYLKNEAQQSIAKRKIYFAGPLKLRQGGLGIVGRFPIFYKNKFWGFSAVVIKLDTFLDVSGIKNIDNSKYYFQFSKFDTTLQKEVFYLPNANYDFSQHYNISNRISDGDWKLYLISKNQNYLYSQIVIPGVIGIIIAALLGFLVYRLLNLPRELQSLVTIQATKLLDSEIKFQSIFDQAALGIAHVDANTGDFIEINNQFCSILGYSQQEMKEKNFQNITHPEDLALDLQMLGQLMDGKIKEYAVEKRYFTKSGTIVWVHLTVSPLLKNDKKLSSVISIVEDISQKKEAEFLIKKNETRFKSLFDDSPLPLREEDFSAIKNYLKENNLYKKNKTLLAEFFTKNQDVVNSCYSLIKVINVNKACLKLYKVKTKEELIQHQAVLHNMHSNQHFIESLIGISQGKKQFSIDTQMKNAEGEYRDINLRWNVIKGNKRSFERVIVSSEDITERLTSEKIILETKQKVESLINTIDGIVWECDADTFSFNFISQKVEHILGYTPEEWLANPNFWSDHIYQEDTAWVQEYCKTKTVSSEDHDFEYRMIAKDGSIVWLRDIVNIIYENGKAASLRGIMIDITKAKQAQDELNISFTIVSEQNKRLLNFSYIVSHNLRSHTSNIASVVALIESSESEEERQEMMELLKSASASLNETMLHLNEVINIRNNLGLISETLNLRDYVSRAAAVLADEISTQNVILQNQIPDNILIKYNPAYLESILFNIISNSIRYRDNSRQPLITVSLYEENKKKIIQITDNGIGIDLVKNADKIFGMYKTFTSHADARGIGLFITKNQIDAMGGNITVESEPNIGTTFKIDIQ
ncbi:PAS domain S-box protein [Flavobacterium turcicum]|uniref:histidine kinase n=1 Tax=Flavobacterium turcicum TaxID=2764718 RepID=A0ABR7JE17_9FLAO|nr:PAS domain S-box protein [Flavobacterium turcicum]MBC5862756.1 PAS domain S-box protein [Flavobacterium turcicum]NHL01488.1 PAS domain S-box protein [Flavobacterium turcicum]